MSAEPLDAEERGSSVGRSSSSPRSNTPTKQKTRMNGVGFGGGEHPPEPRDSASDSSRSGADWLGRVEVNGDGKHGSSTGGTRALNGTSRRSKASQGVTRPLVDVVSPNMLEEERSRLVQERREQLRKINERNTDLVRELFHMEKYTLMTKFQPEEARKDNSPVFEAYHQQYDLLRFSNPSAGPSRHTRRANNERRQLVSAPVAPSPLRSSNKTQMKAKGQTARTPDEIPNTSQKRKGKMKEVAQDVITEAMDVDTASEEEGPLPTVVVKRDKSLHGILRRTSSVPNGADRSVVCLQPESASAGPLKKVRLKRPTTPPPSTGKRRAPDDDPPSLDNTPASSPSVKFAGIKRVKLIVRRSTTYTNPKQLPPPPKFNNSLSQFLHSYITVDDQDMDQESFLQRVKHEAEIREKEQLFRKQGRFIPGTQVLFGSIPDESVYIPPMRDWKDVWDHVVDEVVLVGKARARKASGSKYMASQVAAKVQAYYDGLELKKARALEEEKKRLRNLAKTTMKLVIAEWKKAVFYIREKERKAEEAEELKRGQDHLDAILDQSGQLLETQQGNLFRSRSGSVDNWRMDEEDSDDEDEEDDQEEDDEGGVEDSSREPTQHPNDRASEPGHTEDGDNASSLYPEGSRAPTTVASDEDDSNSDDEDAEREVGTSLLLAMSSPQRPPLSPTPGTPATDASGALGYDDDPDVSTAQLLADDTTQEPEIEDDGTDDLELQLPASSPPTAPSTYPAEAARAEEVARDLDPGAAQDDDRPREVSPNANVAISGATPEEPPMDVDAPSHTETKPDAEELQNDDDDDGHMSQPKIPSYLRPYAVAPVEWDPSTKVAHPLLLRGVLRPYQQSGLEWLASLHTNRLNGILADEMGLGKTIQTIALLAHLACDRGVWGPHLIVVPTSVLLNWEMEFKKFLPGFRVLSYHGSTKRRKELRQGWNDKFHFNVCITSYALVAKDTHIFKRKAWYYMILDEAHMIKNFKSQRWNILLMFRSFRRLLLTGTPLQNNLTELWALLQFLMSGSNFANLKEFGEWFSNPLERAIEMGSILDEENLQRVSKLHTVLRPYLLRRLKRDVEKELPSKFEHLTLCPLSKRQRFLYDEFMSRAQTRDALQSGVYQKIANILMQLRKVCNHPDLFEVRPIVTSFVMPRSAVADFEIKELLIRRRLLAEEDEDQVDLSLIGLRFIDRVITPLTIAQEVRRLDATTHLLERAKLPGEPPPKDMRTIAGFHKWVEYQNRANSVARWTHLGYLNRLRCARSPILPEEIFTRVCTIADPILPFPFLDTRFNVLNRVYLINKAVKSYVARGEDIAPLIDKFAFATPAAIAMDLPRIALAGYAEPIKQQPSGVDQLLHRAAVKLQIAFPDPSLLQYDCGKLQMLADLLREKKAGGHRALIFTQMTRILDVLEIFLNYHGYLYLRLDGATKIEDRQYITERFNADPRIFCFISSSRSGGVGINLTGADTVIFYDSDFNPQMDRQCEDRAHRIGQIRDVHIYRFVSQHTVEEAMLRKANQKRSLDDIVIQKGEFDWRTLFNDEATGSLTRALDEFDDLEDRQAAVAAEREEISLLGADANDFEEGEAKVGGGVKGKPGSGAGGGDDTMMDIDGGPIGDGEEDEEGGAVADYMVQFVETNYDFFRDWRL